MPFEPINGVQIQVIGRGSSSNNNSGSMACESLGERHASLPTTGELAEPRLRGELQAGQHHLDLRLQAPTVAVLQVCLEVV